MKHLLIFAALATATAAAAQTQKPPVLAPPVPPSEAACFKVVAKPSIQIQGDTITRQSDTTYYHEGRVINTGSKVVITPKGITTTDKVATFKHSIIVSHEQGTAN